MEEGQTNALKDPHKEERPKRRSQEIGQGGQGKKEGTGNHEGFLGDSQKRFSDKGPESQRGNEEDPDEDANFCLRGSGH